MADPADTRKTASPSDSSSSSDPVVMSDSNASEDATGQTVMQATLSETGEEASEVRQRSGAVGVGFKIGPYQLVRKLGQGGMGAVYEAQHTKLDKTFALKVLPPGFASNAAALSRFEREMKAVGKLDHPNIIRATNADEFNGTHYLVMEYVEGCDLSRFVKDRGTLSIAEACETIRQAALGLQHAHEHGLVHRDIKPSNLLVARSDRIHAVELEGPDESGHYKRETVAIKILDLGLARLEDDVPGGGLTSSGQVLGTPDYMAPEQWDDTHAADARADLYALGCTLFFVLTGKAPFAEEGNKPSMMRLMKAHVDGPIPDLLAVRADVPAELNSIYRRLLAKNPDDRFQTAAAVVAALESFTRQFVVPPSGGSSRSPVAPRQESRTSLDVARETAPPSTTDIPRAPGSPVAERQGYEDTPTTSIITPRPAPRATSTTRQRVIIIATLASVLLVGIVFQFVTNSRTNSNSNLANRAGGGPPPPPRPPGGGGPPPPGSPKQDVGWHGWPADAPKPAIAPFNADEARQHQEAWAKYLGVPVEYTNSLGMKFRLIPPGEFTMGSTSEEIEEALKFAGEDQQAHVSFKSEGPQHKVILTRPFYLGMYEVTQADYENVIGTTPSHFAPTGMGKEAVAGMDTTSHPVETVSWNDAAEFCAKLSQQEKLKPFYFRASETITPLDGTGYRLPTEAEWEFSCRAGTGTKYWIGDRDEDLTRVGWSGGNSGSRTHVVGQLKSNQFGLYDISGNVFEWAQDEWGLNYYGQFQEKPSLDPNGPHLADPQRVIRGGGWSRHASDSRASYRYALGPTSLASHIGFRVSLTIDAVRQALKATSPAMPNRPKASVTDASTSSTAKPLTPLPPLDLDETDPLPGWELPAGAPPPVVAPCEPTLATERQQLWAEFLKRPVIEELDLAALRAGRGSPDPALDPTEGLPNNDKTSKDKETDAPSDKKYEDKKGDLRSGEAAGSGDPRRAQDDPRRAQTMKFALIPPGEFRKIFTRPRDPAIEPDMPVRRFRLTKPYALSTTEVTWDQFRQFVEATGYQTEAETNGLGGRDRAFKPDPKINWRTPGWKPDPNEPVTQVTPRDAEAFCAWLTESARSDRIHAVDGKPTPNTKQPDAVKRPDKSGHYERYRLPTEAEWVHACRAGSVHKHVVGPEPGDLADYAWTQEFLDPNPQASPLHLVAQKKPNPFGLHDTLGNVWEYAQDYFSPALFPYAQISNPLGVQSSSAIGGGWECSASLVHPDFIAAPYSAAQQNVGFRVLKQFDGEPLPGPLDRPLVLRPGQPLSVYALVPRPEKIPGLQNWSIELAGPHSPYTTAIAASPKGDLIVTGSQITGKISLWDRDGNYQRALLGHDSWITSLDFSSDGQWLASSEVGTTVGCTVRIWNVATGAHHALIPIPAQQTHEVSFSPDGKHLAVSIDGYGQTSFLIINLATGRLRLPATGEQRGRGLSWSPDGTQIASSAGQHRLTIWDATTLKVLRDVDAPLSSSLEWSPDGNSLAMQGSDGKVAIRDAKTLEVIHTLDAILPLYSPHALAWLPDNKRLMVAQGGSSPSGVFDVTTGEQLTKFAISHGAFPSIAALNNGAEAVVEIHGRLHFYDTSTGQKLREGKERGVSHGQSILSPNGEEVFTQGGIVVASDAKTGDRKRHFSVSVDGQSLLSPSADGSLLTGPSNTPTLRLVDSHTGKVRRELPHGEGNVTRVAWSPDGKWLATGASDKLVRVWNVATGKIEHELAGHTGTIASLAWSPDGNRLASHAQDKTVRLWDPRAGKLVATYDQFPEALPPLHGDNGSGHGLAWTSDSRRLWIALTNHIVSLDVETGTFGPLENFSNGNSVTFLNTSPDGQRLLAREGAQWTFVRGRDAQDRRLLGQHLGWTAQWHPDSRRFLGWEPHYGTVGFDVETNRRLGLLFPWLTGDHWLCLGPTGHYRGSPGVEDQFVYVAMLPDGSQRTYTPAEFAEKFGWKNDPEKAELLGK